jgi:hypothetical protein
MAGDESNALAYESAVMAAPACQPGTVRSCGIELGTHNGVVDCAVGSQLCNDDTTWSTCYPDAQQGSVQVIAPSVNSGNGLLRSQSIGGTSSTCVDDPCNPVCYSFDDSSDTGGISSTPQGTVISIGAASGGTLQSSNLPSAFKTKGSLDSQCTTPCTGQSCLEACQFDQHCSGNQCVAFQTLEAGSCTGIDITAPTTCVPATGSRKVTVCNRGSAPAAPGVKCYVLPGYSPQYPNASPDLSKATLVLQTATTIQSGYCETQTIAESSFPSDGVETIVCNPPEHVVLVPSTTAGPSFPIASAAETGFSTWTTPENAYASDSVVASASPSNPSGSSTGTNYPNTNSTPSGDASWSNGNNGYTVDGSYATTASPAKPDGTSGPNYPSSLTTPSSGSELS